MRAVKQWAKHKPTFIATLAIQLVSFSDDLYENLPQIKERSLYGRQFSVPVLSDWFALYRFPRKSMSAFVDFIAEFHPQGPQLVVFALITRRIVKVIRRDPNYFKGVIPDPEEVQKWKDFIDELKDHTLTNIADDLQNLPLDPETRPRMQQFLDEREQELAFFFLIICPCLLLYQKSPFALYSQARAGNIDAIENLIKLDATMAHELVIAQHLVALKYMGKTNDYERLMAASHKPAVANYSKVEEARRRSKYRLAGLIYSLSQAMGYDMDYPTIGALFDAYSQDKGDECDYDLPTGESFRKSVFNNSIPWQKLFQSSEFKK